MDLTAVLPAVRRSELPTGVWQLQTDRCFAEFTLHWLVRGRLPAVGPVLFRTRIVGVDDRSLLLHATAKPALGPRRPTA